MSGRQDTGRGLRKILPGVCKVEGSSEEGGAGEDEGREGEHRVYQDLGMGAN